MTEDFQSRNDQSKKEHKKRKVEMQRKEGNEAPAFIRFFSDRRTHIILGIILISPLSQQLTTSRPEKETRVRLSIMKYHKLFKTAMKLTMSVVLSVHIYLTL